MSGIDKDLQIAIDEAELEITGTKPRYTALYHAHGVRSLARELRKVMAERDSLQAERDELRAALSEVIYHVTHSMDCKHGDGFTYDFCPVVKAKELTKGGEA